MTTSNRRPRVSSGQPRGPMGTARERLPQAGGSYSIHPLVALDGVCLFVTRGGEPVGFYFGVTARTATAVAAADLFAAVTSNGPTA